MRHYFFKTKFQRKAWSTLVMISVMVLLLVLVTEFIPVSHEFHHYIEIMHKLEFLALVILFMDLIMMFSIAKNKVEFVEEESLLIISFIPFGRVFYFFESLQLFQRLTEVGGKLKEVIHISAHLNIFMRFIRPLAQILHRHKRHKKLSKNKKLRKENQ
ncbi:MAG: hypothetical protein ABIA76_02040 [Candidatus Diapherotrites archaeon]